MALDASFITKRQDRAMILRDSIMEAVLFCSQAQESIWGNRNTGQAPWGRSDYPVLPEVRVGLRTQYGEGAVGTRLLAGGIID